MTPLLEALLLALAVAQPAPSPAAGSAQSAPANVAEDYWSIPLAQLREGMESDHPVRSLIYASRLFEEASRREETLFWFYASQLRWRTRLSCRDFPPGGEGAAFGAMFAALGPPFNEWAADNVDLWIATLDTVHQWDIDTKERFAEDAQCEAVAAEQRAGMMTLRQDIIDSRAELEAAAEERRAERADENPQ